MAIQIPNLVLENGLEVSNVYCKIVSIDNLSKDNMIINIGYSINSDSKEFNTERKSIPYIINSTNPIEQAYIALKLLPRYATAVDC